MNISSEKTVADFIQVLAAQSHSAANSDARVTVLNHYGLIAFSGVETGKFLQGQTTCNIKDLTTTKSLAGACCSPKGRMYCNVQLALDNDGQHWLRLRRDVLDSSLQTLNKYLALFRGSKAINCSDSHIVLGVSGSKAKALINTLVGSCPEQRHDSVSGEDIIVVCIDAEQSRYEMWLSASKAISIWSTVMEHATLGDSSEWLLANIQSGIGDVHAETQDEFVPQMLNLQALNAISFNKGCYTGQEIVARMHYLGKLKKRMYRATVSGVDIAPAAGSELYAVNAISGELQSVGHVVDAVIHNGQCELLAVIPDELVESAKPVQLGKNGGEITVVPLPYAITTALPSKQ